ncbi:Uu.00g012650.m01.CDS01 [Anthostomella pinea]|uniref:Uu.00g012650.m01.CDS01 n=1 Tax=Anthostomella pinea TaxID=933095 RepID=A0AAI8YQA7_9PEZI|nr:Uu.00g012650.m01.CDS01 [Anthostomella pinea]
MPPKTYEESAPAGNSKILPPTSERDGAVSELEVAVSGLKVSESKGKSKAVADREEEPEAVADGGEEAPDAPSGQAKGKGKGKKKKRKILVVPFYINTGPEVLQTDIHAQDGPFLKEDGTPFGKDNDSSDSERELAAKIPAGQITTQRHSKGDGSRWKPGRAGTSQDMDETVEPK